MVSHSKLIFSFHICNFFSCICSFSLLFFCCLFFCSFFCCWPPLVVNYHFRQFHSQLIVISIAPYGTSKLSIFVQSCQRHLDRFYFIITTPASCLTLSSFIHSSFFDVDATASFINNFSVGIFHL